MLLSWDWAVVRNISFWKVTDSRSQMSSERFYWAIDWIAFLLVHTKLHWTHNTIWCNVSVLFNSLCVIFRHACWPSANLFLWPSLSICSFHSFPLSVCLYPSLSLCQRVPQSPALPYVTGAHIRENNLWWPWIRDAVEFPMIQVWYGNSLKYLDSGGLSDQCSPACCWQTRVSETSCQEDPWGWRRVAQRRGDEEEKGQEKGQKKWAK